MIPLSERAVIAGKYRLERKLEAGGMGAIWVARHLALDEDVAIKFMSHTLPEPAEARARFAREARAASRARGPNVVQVLDHGVDGDVPYLVMELLEGEHLGKRLTRVGRLSLPEASIIADQVARALTRAHRAGIVHRDLKPANLFLARLDDEEIVKVLDFGIAKQQHGAPEDMTQTDVLIGSPQYMSPEQARGARDVDHRADLWSLGAILFRAVTGAPAFDGSSAVDVIVQICAGPLPVPSEVASDLPPELDAFFARALHREPAKRFASAREMTGAFAVIARGDEPRTTSRSASGTRLRGGVRADLAVGETDPPPPRSEVETAPSPGEAEIEAFLDRAFSALGGAGAERDPAAPPPTPRSPENAPRAPEVTVPVLRRLGVVSKSTPPAGRPEPAAPTGDRWLAGEPHGRAQRPASGAPARGAVGTLIDQGFTALRHGQHDTARRAWRAALELDPGNRTLALNLRRLDALGGR